MKRYGFDIAGMLAIISGLIWMAQGSGYFPYPSESFMINQKPWITYGALMAIAGAVVIVAARYLRKARSRQ